ncbi:hypothetical protein [Mammaliicoccus phage vB_MscM-PMS3]|nr:hypothetical protein [Mammaliicoccus phage vB_MscM-PMS3]WBF82114.1 hypothetical protein [Mammaliicoccus virus vB_MscM-PMS2]
MGKGKGKQKDIKGVIKSKKLRRVLIVAFIINVVLSVRSIKKSLDTIKILVGEELNYQNRLDSVDTEGDI